ncbi:MAG: metallophosphoesterase, partial [Haloarculaceae archaeon]
MSTQTDWEKVARAIALLLVLGFVLLFGAFWVYHRQLQRQPTGKSVTVAFIADGGMTDDSHAVLQLIHREDADILVHSGDFDYHNDPAGWDALLNETLGSDFPVVATIGNHDRQEWAGYRRHLAARTDRAEDLHCTGDLGLHSTCTFRGVTVVQSSDEVCSLPSGDDEEFPAACGEYGSYEPEQYVRTQLEHSNSTLNVCSWHYPNHAFQVGEKSGVSLDMYDTCREAGGDFVVTGHDHAYARSYPMRDFDSQTIADRSNPYVLGNGSTMAL